MLSILLKLTVFAALIQSVRPSLKELNFDVITNNESNNSNNRKEYINDDDWSTEAEDEDPTSGNYFRLDLGKIEEVSFIWLFGDHDNNNSFKVDVYFGDVSADTS